ncbi:MnmC family methyltransferase [Phenylobacterium sp.]|uniref:spermidine synthase n=1 Tax=Phenylobacterium sp. TaxID=1871053 RepID=UPI002899437E|nr:MnmC family methyltransferase [Phenylobacterium sp.]
MIPWVHLATAVMPDDGGELRLMQRGAEFSIMSGAIELMSSRVSGSEKALATLACERLRDRPRPHILIGGFGMGFTLRAALENLGPEAQVTVGELVPEIIAWARGPMAHLSGECLKDPRLTLIEGDVGALIGAGRASYDAILLDVDNGPESLSRTANDQLYSDQGLAAARRALRPGGMLAVWSSARDERFTKRLRRAGYEVEEVGVRATGGKRGARHMIWMASAPGRP